MVKSQLWARARTALGLRGLAVLVLIAVGAFALGASLSAPTVSSAVSLVSTVTLTAVTVVYVMLTKNLVDLQHEGLAQASAAEKRRQEEADRTRQRDAIYRAWRETQLLISASVSPDGYATNLFGRLVSLQQLRGETLHARMSSFLNEFDEEVARLGEFGSSVSLLAPDLPSDLHVWQLTAESLRCRAMASSLHVTYLQAKAKAKASDKELDMSDVRDEWTLHTRPLVGGLEWQDFVEGGGPFSKFVNLFHNFESACLRRLRDA